MRFAAMSPRPQRLARLIGVGALALGLAACGGGEVSGQLSGLGTGLTVTLANNGSDTLTLRANGTFAFQDLLDPGDAFLVTVRTQPVGQVCTVANGSGTINTNGDGVDNVRVSCAFSSGLRGTVSGLSDGMALTLANGASTLVVAANGPFAFPDTLAEGAAFSLLVQVQPFGANCSVSGGVGIFRAATFSDIVVSCN